MKMQVQRISNNNTNFGSKIRFNYNQCGGGSKTSLNELYLVLENGRAKVDRTLLRAYKGLLNDGKENTYTFFDDCLNRSSYLKVEDSTGNNYYKLPRWEQDLKYNGIRDMIVDIARKEGIISGKPFGLKNLEGLYNSRDIYGDASKMNKRLAEHGFKKTSPKSESDLKEENLLVQEELKEIEKLKSSDSKYKDGYINYLKSVIRNKINAKYKSEYEELIDTQKRVVKSNEV